MQFIFASIRIAVVTMFICVGVYTAIIWGLAQTIAPDNAQASLLTRPDGTVIGSSQVAQAFTKPEYFWPRPSAVDYKAEAAGGSNKSPTSPDVMERAKKIVEAYGATAEKPLPAELAAASGAGLDPHISEGAALYQAGRVAQARGVSQSDVEAKIRQSAFSPGGPLTSDRLVNVLELNMALDGIAVP